MIWAIIIIGTVVIALAFFEWRSWKKPLPGALEDTHRFSRGSGGGGSR